MIEEMQQYYAERAGEYDSSMGYDDPATTARLAEVIAAVRSVCADRRVLELACGPGFWTSQIAPVAEHVTATDYNETTLVQARRKSWPEDRVTFRQADAYDPAAVPGEFQLILAVDWFAHVPRSRIPAFLKALADRLPAGSHIVFLDQLPGSHSLTGIVDDQGNHLQERRLADGRTFRVIKNFFTEPELHQFFSPIAKDLKIQQFPNARRILVTATLP